MSKRPVTHSLRCSRSDTVISNSYLRKTMNEERKTYEKIISNKHVLLRLNCSRGSRPKHIIIINFTTACLDMSKAFSSQSQSATWNETILGLIPLLYHYLELRAGM